MTETSSGITHKEDSAEDADRRICAQLLHDIPQTINVSAVNPALLAPEPPAVMMEALTARHDQQIMGLELLSIALGLSTFANVPLNSSSVPRTLMRFSRNSTRYHWETSNVSCVLLNCSEFPENRGGMYRSILSPRSPDLGFFLAVGFGLSRAALRTAQMAHTDAPVRPSYGLFSNLFFLFPGRQMF